jgi:hypothetical protein
MEIGWKKRGILPPFYHPRRMQIFKCLKKLDKNGGGGGSRIRMAAPCENADTSGCYSISSS